jgi:hypothetical protein
LKPGQDDDDEDDEDANPSTDDDGTFLVFLPSCVPLFPSPPLLLPRPPGHDRWCTVAD